jgi:hypothetical protein
MCQLNPEAANLLSVLTPTEYGCRRPQLSRNRSSVIEQVQVNTIEALTREQHPHIVQEAVIQHCFIRDL